MGQDGQLRRWVHDVLAKDVWEGNGSGSMAGGRVQQHHGFPPYAGITVADSAAAATQATMATAAEPAAGVPRVVAVLSSSHFDERRWQAAVGPQEAAVPIVNVAPYNWCVAERWLVSWQLKSYYLRNSGRHTYA